MAKVTFHFDGQKQTVEGKKGESLLKIALDNMLPMEHACGGNGFCTTCMCEVKAGGDLLNERNDREENMGITNDPYRLGCQARVDGEGEIEIELTE